MHYEKEKNFICACRGADDSFPALRLQSKREGRNFSGKSAKRREIFPTAATAEDALHAGELFVLEDEGVVQAAARINRVQVPEYANADWEYSDAQEDQIMVLHTLVVEPKSSGRGYGSAFVDFYEKYALEQGCPYLRMDTNEKNAAARRLYARLGYKEIGIVDCEFNGIAGVHLVCLEKSLLT